VSGNEVTGIRGEVRDYQRLLKAEAWDIIWINGAQIWATDIVLQSPDVRHRTVVLTLHGLPARQAQGGRYADYYDRLASTIPGLGALIGVSHTSGEVAFCSEHKLPPPTVISNGADLGRWSKRLAAVRAPWGIGDAPWVVAVANHSPYKNHRLFFRAVASAQRIVPRTRGTIIGRHHAARKLRLGMAGIIGGCWYECAARAKISRGINLLANASRDEVIAAVQQADVFLMTSAWEGSSVALIEAMAAGTAWISTPVGSAIEESGGIVVSDEREMVRALQTLLVDRNLRIKLGNAGRLHAQQHHDWDVIATSYERLFERVRAANC
jgi:glycosyltransferase involved in cell wall biosynthesis